MKPVKFVATIALAGAVALMTTGVLAKDRTTGRGTGGIIYVTSQDLYYDTFGLAALPFNGTENFQQLVPTDNGAYTEFGPGDTGYYGGRWWVDTNEDGYMDETDTFFLCPLLGPGREHAES